MIKEADELFKSILTPGTLQGNCAIDSARGSWEDEESPKLSVKSTNFSD
jgi:hypothetical protein